MPKIRTHTNTVILKMKLMHYQTRITTAMQNLPFSPGTLATAHVQHDAHCPMLRGKPTCRCSPDIFIESGTGRIEVLPDGGIRHPGHPN
jgi:hypothetical protein